MSGSTHSSTAPAARGQCEAIDLAGKIALIDGHWQPRVVAEMNDYQFKVVKLEGEFVWHNPDVYKRTQSGIQRRLIRRPKADADR